MHHWQEDMLDLTEHANDEHQAFQQVERIAQSLGFEYCAYRSRFPIPIGKDQAMWVNNYPRPWEKKYIKANYAAIDPTVVHGLKCQTPLLWRDIVFKRQKRFWEEAQAHGLRFGWTMSSLDIVGAGGILSIARSHEAITARELECKEKSMRKLTHEAHRAFSRIYKGKHIAAMQSPLTRREVETHRWTASGQTSMDIAVKLHISVDTVNFHLKNAVRKLNARNKTHAAVCAAYLGLLL